MRFTPLNIAGLVLIEPRRHGDARGFFAETFRSDLFAQEVSEAPLVQENESMSARVGTLRGLHFQIPPAAQGKLVRCTAGALLDVAVDIRIGSPTFGRWVAYELSPENGRQLWVPPGCAHGFCTLAPDTVISYKVTAYYSAEHDRGLAWDDVDLAIVWPDVANPDTLSAKDRLQPKLAELPAHFTLED